MRRRGKHFLILFLVLLPAGILSSAPAGQNQKDQITHVLNRLAFGPRPGDVDRVQQIGLRQYIEQQLHPEKIDDRRTEDRLRDFASLHLNGTGILERYPEPQRIARELGLRNPKDQNQNSADQAAARQQVQAYLREHGLQPPQQLLQELTGQKLVRAVDSERQLQEVMTDFWFNHFNVFFGKGADKWLTTDFEMNAIRPNTLGKFKDLLLATAKSPAMLFYLDNHLSMAPNPRAATALARRAAANRPAPKRGQGINENYARELMELHTMGVDGGYTQKDVQEVARAFTGWTIEQPRQNGTFLFRPMMHDRGQKIVLGHTIKAGGGMEDGEQVIDILAHQPSAARFIATKLVRRFVSDNPPASLVDRVAATYMKTDGDIREMLRAIFYSEEFMSAENYAAKTKSPFEYVASAIRSLDGHTSGSQQLAQMIGRMGQPLYQYQAPTGYPDRADEWMSNGTIIERINFAIALTSNHIPGTTVDLTGIDDPKLAAQRLGSPEFQKR
jgi:uncharacterized protein (DUF1800 family)